MSEHELLQRITSNPEIFGGKPIIRDRPHSGIMRLLDIAARRQAKYCLSVLTKYGADLARGAIVTIDTRRTRVRLSDD
jgi:predicted nuclease of predicted toxin-antitoxin system